MSTAHNAPAPPALQALTTALRPAAPTHISTLLRMISSQDGYRWFRATTRELMPEAADAIPPTWNTPI